MKRILAWIGIFVIAALFLVLVLFTAFGASSGAIMAALSCLIILPVVLYACILFYKAVHPKDEDEP